MKKTPLKRKTPLQTRKRWDKQVKDASRTLHNRSGTMKKKGVRKDTSSKVKKRIQALLRGIVIKRDGGCVLRNFPEAGQCGWYKDNGELILQAEHLCGRANSISYADLDNIVCLCVQHHFFFKKQHGAIYWNLIQQVIGEERWEKVQGWERDKTPHRFTLYDWQQVEEKLKNMKNY